MTGTFCDESGLLAGTISHSIVQNMTILNSSLSVSSFCFDRIGIIIFLNYFSKKLKKNEGGFFGVCDNVRIWILMEIINLI